MVCHEIIRVFPENPLRERVMGSLSIEIDCESQQIRKPLTIALLMLAGISYGFPDSNTGFPKIKGLKAVLWRALILQTL